jgi:hypothetical protein
MGLVWTGTGSPKQLVMRSGPDRIWSTEHIELEKNKSLWINNNPVLSESTLGSTVIASSLTSVGTLSSLHVAGATILATTKASELDTDKIVLSEGSEVVTVTANSIDANLDLDLTVAGQQVLHADSNNINIGNQNSTARNIRLFGNVSVNVNTPDPSLQFSVAGNIGFAGRKFITGTAAPIAGTFSVGDTCWNTTPNIGGYMGWVCISAGTPGQWAPFGMIG